MKFLMTGHTSPIGSVLFEHLSFTHQVTGISRQSGYDLNKFEDIQKIINDSINYDHFINLAHVGDAQCQLLSLIYKKWSEVNHLGKIISFGTLGTELPEDILKKTGTDLDYFKKKIHLENIHKCLSIQKIFGIQPQSVLIRILNFGKKTGSRQGEPSCNKEEIIRTVDYVLNETLYISKIDLRKI